MRVGSFICVWIEENRPPAEVGPPIAQPGWPFVVKPDGDLTHVAAALEVWQARLPREALPLALLLLPASCHGAWRCTWRRCAHQSTGWRCAAEQIHVLLLLLLLWWWRLGVLLHLMLLL